MAGQLVANLGHYPSNWMKSFGSAMGWRHLTSEEFFQAVPLTAYNAITPIEAQATKHLIGKRRPIIHSEGLRWG